MCGSWLYDEAGVNSELEQFGRRVETRRDIYAFYGHVMQLAAHGFLRHFYSVLPSHSTGLPPLEQFYTTLYQPFDLNIYNG